MGLMQRIGGGCGALYLFDKVFAERLGYSPDEPLTIIKALMVHQNGL